MEILKYCDERDKAYGIAGMAVVLKVLQEEQYLSFVDLDASASECVCFSSDFALRGNPLMSAKMVWNQIFNELRVTSIATLGNLVCRRALLDSRRPDRDEYAAIRDAVMSDAAEHLSLDSEEVEAFYEHCRGYALRIFGLDEACRAAKTLATHIISRRRLSGSEVTDLLSGRGI